MKLTKRFLSFVLALTLAIALALPAFAEGEASDPAMPVITEQLEGDTARIGDVENSFLERVTLVIASPILALSTLLQRLGVSGHTANTISNMILFPFNLLAQPFIWLLLLTA